MRYMWCVLPETDGNFSSKLDRPILVWESQLRPNKNICLWIRLRTYKTMRTHNVTFNYLWPEKRARTPLDVRVFACVYGLWNEGGITRNEPRNVALEPLPLMRAWWIKKQWDSRPKHEAPRTKSWLNNWLVEHSVPNKKKCGKMQTCQKTFLHEKKKDRVGRCRHREQILALCHENSPCGKM